MEKDLHIAEIGGYFHENDVFEFLSNQNLYEYDFIIVDTTALIIEINKGFITTIDKKAKDLKDFINRKNIPVVIFFSGSGSFSLNNGSECNIFQILDLNVEEEKIQGKKIEINPDSLFANFLDRNRDNFEYEVTFAKHPGVSIGNAKSRSKSIGFYTKDFIFLPTIVENNDINDNDFLHELYQLAQSVRRDDEVLSIPLWANNYFLPGEEVERSKLEAINQEILKLEKEQQQSQVQLLTFLPLKQLWTATGIVLENAVKRVFIELGFTILESEAGRDDITMKWQGRPVIVEIKGQNKSAAEKNAAQLEKWASIYYAEKGVIPKSLLIVNTFKELPLEQRIEQSFPEQMIPYSVSRKHCLLTTIQLSGLLLACRSKAVDKQATIDHLLATNGRYDNYNDWKAFLSTKHKTILTEKTRKKNSVKVAE